MQPLRSVFPFTKQFLEILSGKSSAVCLAGLLGRRNGPLRPTFVAAKRTSDAPKHRPGDFPDSLSRDRAFFTPFAGPRNPRFGPYPDFSDRLSETVRKLSMGTKPRLYGPR